MANCLNFIQSINNDTPKKEITLKKSILALTIALTSLSGFAGELNDEVKLSQLSPIGGQYYKALVSRVKFNQEVLVVKGEDDVWFQEGRMIHSREDVDSSKAYCKLDTDEEDKLSGNEMFYTESEDGVTIKAGAKRAVEKVSSEVLQNPTRYAIDIEFLNDGLGYAGNFIDDITCVTPASDLRELTVGDLRSITGGVLSVDNINVEE